MSERKRDAKATKHDILLSAQRAFSRNGFDAASVREIASDAGVNQALINRYYGSKEKLFYSALDGNISVKELLELPKENFGKTVAQYFAMKSHTDKELDITLAILKSLGSPVVGPYLKEETDNRLIYEISEWLDGENKEQRAALIAAQFVGFDVLRRAVQVNAFSEKHIMETVRIWGETLQLLVDDA